MMLSGLSGRMAAWAMALVMMTTALPFNAVHAAMVTTDQVVTAQTLSADRTRVLDFMAREDMRREMVRLGIDPDEAARRTASLSDEEIQQIAGQLDQIPAGQSAVVAVIVAAMALFLVLIITDVLGYTDIFPFIENKKLE